MKLTSKKVTLLLTSVLICGKLLAQTADSASVKTDYITPFSGHGTFRTWSVGIHTGLMSTFNVLNTNNRLDFTLPNVQIGYGGYIKKQVLPGYGIQVDVLLGKLNGDNAQPNAEGISPFKSFTTKLNYAASLSSNFTLANINWRSVKSTVQPYLTAGAGLMNYTPSLTLASGTVRSFKPSNTPLNEFYVPLGVGLKFDVARGVNLDLGYQLNFVYSDNLDGYKYGTTNDKYSYVHIGLELAIGKRSKPQLAAHNPVSSMRQEYVSAIQDIKTGWKAQIDSTQAKNQALQQQLEAAMAAIAKLMADSDGDGVSDVFDKCPNTPAGTKVDGSGCPLPVVTPEEKVYITEADKQVVTEAIKNLQFNFGSTTLNERSYPGLIRLAGVLAEKKLHLKLSGYTDNVGSAAANIKVSLTRAEAIKMFLVSKGADPALIQTEGLGKANPIASNKTAAGRKLNRRVEFSLY